MLFETICIHNGAIQHLSLHQMRLERSQAALFEEYEPIDLGKVVRPPSGKGVLKCRVLYAQRLAEVTYEPYRPRPVSTLKAIEARIDYAHKFSDREAIEDLFARRGEADDILIIREGMVTDTSVANIAFLKDRHWYTPKNPLLKGTTRERLLRSGFLIPREIRLDELSSFEGFALLNAMIGFQPVKHGKIV
ncbi:aminotransferase class IV family protein [Hydrogenimonas urashimensis]|uniref:aminotransferase class IV family protein n=1 Tax=Hydrogenimonas urashimensis TaxID=2740515 RepID=UPI00191658E1|nr:aminotransferase class IV family protein [Hydrogenimonas urashimensis]